MPHEKKFKTFADFWPEYLRLHSKPVTRGVHYAGTLLGVVIALLGILSGHGWLIVVAPLVTYSILFAAHPVFEKNRPATFKNPIFSIGGDFKMLYCWLTGQITREYTKHHLDPTGRDGNNKNA